MKKLSSQGLRYFWPYLLAYPKELIGASLFGIVNGATVVLMTYYIGVSVDLLIGAGQVDFFRVVSDIDAVRWDFSVNGTQPMGHPDFRKPDCL